MKNYVSLGCAYYGISSIGKHKINVFLIHKFNLNGTVNW